MTPHSRPQLQVSLARFRTDVSSSSTPEIPAAAIRPIGTLHLTLGVMSLGSRERIEQALGLLRGVDLRGTLAGLDPGARREVVGRAGNGDGKGGGEEQGGEKKLGSGSGKELDSKSRREIGLDSTELEVTLRGLASMHRPSETSVLYAAPVDEDRRLQSFCQRLRDVFAEADLLVPDSRPLLLHATIVNTVYVPGAKGKGGGHGRNKAKLTIDARDILEKYEEFEWMSGVRVEKVAICRMGAKKLEGGEEEYEVEGEVDMP